MKKLIFILPLFVFLLSGCSLSDAVSGKSEEYLISAMGFDKSGQGIEISVEAVSVNTEDTEDDKRLIIFDGSGNTVKQAFSNAEKKSTQAFDLSHCGIIAVGEGLTLKDFAEICEYCYNRDEINLSVYFVACENAKEMLKKEPQSSVAVGYDLMSMLECQSRLSGREYKNRFYEIEAKILKKDNRYDIPLFGDGYFSDKKLW